MQYSIISKSQLNSNIRMDAEYFSPYYLSIEKKIKTKLTSPLSKYSFFAKKGIFDISPEKYKQQGIPLIRTSEIKSPLINFSSTVFLDHETHKEFQTTELQPGDLVFTKIGAYIGDVAYLPNIYSKYNFSQNVAGVKIKKDMISSEYLLCYFLSKYGRSQILRYSMLSGQGKLELEDVRNIAIVEISHKFQKYCSLIINKIEQIKDNMGKFYKDAENLLLENLDPQEIDRKPKLSYVKNFSDTQNANRIDAEYFHPKYDEIINKIKSYSNGWDTFENLIKLRDKNFTPIESETYDYIELANIAKNGSIVNVEKIQGKDLPTRARRKVKKGDVIVSSVEGSLDSIALITSQYDSALCSTGFYVMYSDAYNSETLFCLMKSVLGQSQLKRGCSGTILTAINSDELSKIILPKISQDTQQKIKEHVSEMYHNQFLSRQLLEIAKRGVEKAIEESEDMAMQWMNEQLEALGVSL